jgi:hypothetical protein
MENFSDMNQEIIKLETEKMWDESHNKLYPDERKMIETPKNCTGFVILTANDRQKRLHIKERTRMQGPYQTSMTLNQGINFSCLCNLKANSPTTRVFLFNHEKKLKAIKNDRYPKILIIKKKYGDFRVRNNIDDPRWATLGNHSTILEMIATNIHYPYETIPSCIGGHTWTTFS